MRVSSGIVIPKGILLGINIHAVVFRTSPYPVDSGVTVAAQSLNSTAFQPTA